MYRILQNVCGCYILRRNTPNTDFLRRDFLLYSSIIKRSWVGTHSSRQIILFKPKTDNKRLFSLLSRLPLKTKNFLSYQSLLHRNVSDHQTSLQFKHKTVLIYLTGVAIFAVGFSYAAVPLYRLYCQATGYGGTTKRADVGDDIQEMERIEERPLTIRFEAATGRTLQWKFKPQQKEVRVAPGETALAFYTAENLTDKPIIGISTYNVIPFDAGQYFNKIQCFCFEEQQLNPNEEVDMPVFFYIDPEFDDDPRMAKVDEIILSYTFFESSDGQAPVNMSHVKK